MIHKTHLYNKGAAMLIIILFFIILSTTLLIGISNPIVNQIKNSNDFVNSKMGYTLADSQMENALYRLNKGKTDAPADISLLGATASAVLTDVSGIKNITVHGAKNIFDRYISASFSESEGVSFNYGLQVGVGGIVMSGSSHIIGNVYANGDITGSGGSGWYSTYITGSATAATLSNPAMTVDISSSTMTTADFNFGLSNTNQDVAQSFVAATSTFINEVRFMIKKTGSPSNVTVKIVNNNSGTPGSTVLTSGTINSSLITNTYSYVPVVMTTQVNLSAGTTYWIVIDNSSNNTSNYYTLKTYNNLYSNGSTKQGRFGNSLSNLSPTTLDFNLQIYNGGDKGVISNTGVGTSGTGSAWANVVTNTTVTGALYCQSGSGNNKACDTTKGDPVSASYPVSDSNIQTWKDDALLGGATSTVTIGGADTKIIGPIKINGDLNVTASGILKMKGTIHVTGNMNISGNGKIYVDNSMGNEVGVIVVDGKITLSGSGGVYGNGQANSYVLISSLKTCTTDCSTNIAIDASGAAGSVILNAPNGSVNFSGSAAVKSVIAKQMNMSGNTEIRYESGLADINFNSGPSGSWSRKSWKEVLGW